ncbi:MAG TPA: cytochrome oxidase small assembly protein [Actinomycetota bacterium]|nr:cytochrome oxidase small assembly protein [Actinomycetota bacterium]
MHSAANRPDDARPARRANVRTALTLTSIAAVFFGGIIAAQFTGASAVGIGIIGFLLSTLGRRVAR